LVKRVYTFLIIATIDIDSDQLKPFIHLCAMHFNNFLFLPRFCNLSSQWGFSTTTYVFLVPCVCCVVVPVFGSVLKNRKQCTQKWCVMLHIPCEIAKNKNISVPVGLGFFHFFSVHKYPWDTTTIFFFQIFCSKNGFRENVWKVHISRNLCHDYLSIRL
jgi:hypothetical protein